MRELTAHEILLVSGGADGDTVDQYGPSPGPTPNWNGFDPGSGGGYSGGDYGGGGGGSEQLAADHLADIANGHQIDVTQVSSLTPLQASALNFLKDVVIPKMTELVGTAKFNDGYLTNNNSTSPIATGQEVSANWAVTDIVVTANKTYTNGGVGETQFDHTTGNVTLEIDINALTNYMGSIGTNGLLYPSLDKGLSYLMHEMTHATNMGQSSDRNMYLPNSDGGVARTALEFTQNEQLAWGGSKAFLALAGYNSTFTPNEGATEFHYRYFGIAG